MTTGTSTPSSTYEGARTPQTDMDASRDSYFPHATNQHTSSSSSSSSTHNGSHSNITNDSSNSNNRSNTNTPPPSSYDSMNNNGDGNGNGNTAGVPRPAQVRQTTSGIGPYPLPALDRDHAAPGDELDLDKQLAKPPLPRSLHSSLRAAAASERRRMMNADDPDSRAQGLAEAKKQWASWAN